MAWKVKYRLTKFTFSKYIREFIFTNFFMKTHLTDHITKLLWKEISILFTRHCVLYAISIKKQTYFLVSDL